jgi:ABA4-like protein
MTTVLFDLTFYLAVPFWLLMIVAPKWALTEKIVATPWIATPPLAVYLIVVLPHFDRLWAAVSRPDLGVLQGFLGSGIGAAAIWAHLIAFDLFIGRWMYWQARERDIHPLVMAPVLVLTILLSPIGLLVFLCIRWVADRQPTRRDRDGLVSSRE